MPVRNALKRVELQQITVKGSRGVQIININRSFQKSTGASGRGQGIT